MNKDYLLDKLLDGSLTNEEMRELESSMLDDTAFSEEVRQLLVVEETIWRSADARFGAAAPFREDVANQVKAEMRANSTVASTATSEIGTAGVRGGGWLRSRMALGVAVGALMVGAVVIGGSMYLGDSSQADDSLADMLSEYKAANDVPLVAVPDEDPGAVSEESVESELVVELASNDESAVTSPLAVDAAATAAASSQPNQHRSAENKRSAPDADQFRGTVVNKEPMRSGKFTRMIANLQDQMQQIERNGDQMALAQTAKKIGVLYRQLGDLDESRAYLERTLNIARDVNFKELQAQTLGELGLLSAADGDLTRAQILLKECIALLSSIRSAESQQWQIKLKEMQTAARP